MSDFLSVTTLEENLSNLDVNEPTSLIHDPVFQAFAAALNDESSDLRDLWQDTYHYQVYPDPVEYLTPTTGLVQHFHDQEPGLYTDYKQMREDLHDLQDLIPGGQETVLEMYQFINTFTGAHVELIRGSIALIGWSLYARMLDRFYGLVDDPQFIEFVNGTIENPCTTTANYNWPSHSTALSIIISNVYAAHLAMNKATQILMTLKTSPALHSFNANITDAKHRREAQQSATAELILSKYIGSQTRSDRARRRTAVTSKNSCATRNRVEKNRVIKAWNAGNIHQLGRLGRVPIGGSVVRALSMIQEGWRVGIQEEEEDEGAGGKKGTTKGMDMEELEEQMASKEPMDGITVGEGFEMLNLYAA